MQILTLAKQMYPWQTDFFLNQYEKAVKRPFGYLLIDLKTTGKETVPLWKSHVRDSLTSHSSGPETHRQTNVKKQLVTPRISQQRIIETVPLWKSQEGLYADLLAWFPLEDPEQLARFSNAALRVRSAPSSFLISSSWEVSSRTVFLSFSSSNRRLVLVKSCV